MLRSYEIITLYGKKYNVNELKEKIYNKLLQLFDDQEIHKSELSYESIQGTFLYGLIEVIPAVMKFTEIISNIQDIYNGSTIATITNSAYNILICTRIMHAFDITTEINEILLTYDAGNSLRDAKYIRIYMKNEQNKYFTRWYSLILRRLKSEKKIINCKSDICNINAQLCSVCEAYLKCVKSILKLNNKHSIHLTMCRLFSLSLLLYSRAFECYILWDIIDCTLYNKSNRINK